MGIVLDDADVSSAVTDIACGFAFAKTIFRTRSRKRQWRKFHAISMVRFPCAFLFLPD